MSVEKGNWLGKNQKEVDAKIQNLDADGNLTGDVTGDLTGNVTGDVTGDVTGTINFNNATLYTEDGAISLTDDVALLNSSSATTQMTLANQPVGTIRDIAIVCRSYTNTCDVDLNILGIGTSTITFDAGGEAVYLRSAGQSGLGSSAWIVLGTYGSPVVS